MKRIILLFMLSLLIAPHAYSGGELAGNGGDGIFCENDKPFAPTILDFYEAQFFDQSYQITFGSESLSIDEKMDLIFDRLSRVDKSRATFYRETYLQFFNKVLMSSDPLVDIDDSFHLTVPKNCLVKQVVIQLENENTIPGIKYVIDKSLWNRLDKDQKTGMILHEIVYGDALFSGHENSIATRKLVSWISSDEFSGVSEQEYKSFLIKNDFSPLSTQPLMKIDFDRAVNYGNGLPSVARLKKGSKIMIDGKPYAINLFDDVSNSQTKTVAQFYSSGALRSLCDTHAVRRDNPFLSYNFEGRGKMVKLDILGAPRNASCLSFSRKGSIDFVRFSEPETISAFGAEIYDVIEVRFSDKKLITGLSILKNSMTDTFLNGINISHCNILPIKYGLLNSVNNVEFFEGGEIKSICQNSNNLSVIRDSKLKKHEIYPERFFPDGSIQSGWLVETGQNLEFLTPSGRRFVVKAKSIDFNDSGTPTPNPTPDVDTYIEFDKDGRILKGVLRAPQAYNLPDGGDVNLVRRFALHANGSLAFGAFETPVEITHDGQNLKCSWAGFYKNGALEFCVPSGSIDFQFKSQLLKMNSLFFHENGNLKSFTTVGSGAKFQVSLQGQLRKISTRGYSGNTKNPIYVDPSYKLPYYYGKFYYYHTQKKDLLRAQNFPGDGDSHDSAHDEAPVFDKNGNLRKAIFSQAYEFQRTDGAQSLIRAGSYTFFEEGGLLESSSQDWFEKILR